MLTKIHCLLLIYLQSRRFFIEELFTIRVGVFKKSDIESVIVALRKRKQPLPIALFFKCQAL